MVTFFEEVVRSLREPDLEQPIHFEEVLGSALINHVVKIDHLVPLHVEQLRVVLIVEIDAHVFQELQVDLEIYSLLADSLLPVSYTHLTLPTKA